MAMMRLFFAVPIAPRATLALAALRAQLLSPRGWSWLAERDWHITVAFLGETDGALLPALCDLGERVAADAAQSSIALNSLQWWPAIERPRLLAAVGEANAALLAMRKALHAGLREIGVSYDGKPLRPHATLMRLQRNVLPSDLSLPPCAVDVPVEQLALYRSERERGVTHYRPLWQADLSGMFF